MVCSCFRLFYCSRLDSANVGGHVGGGGIVFEVFWVVVVCSLGKYFSVRVLYVCMCVHLGESALVAGALDSLMSQSQ